MLTGGAGLGAALARGSEADALIAAVSELREAIHRQEHRQLQLHRLVESLHNSTERIDALEMHMRSAAAAMAIGGAPESSALVADAHAAVALPVANDGDGELQLEIEGHAHGQQPHSQQVEVAALGDAHHLGTTESERDSDDVTEGVQL